LIRSAVRDAHINLKLDVKPSIVFTDDVFEQFYSQRCACSASSQIDGGSFVLTGFNSSDSRLCIEVHAEETESSEDCF